MYVDIADTFIQYIHSLEPDEIQQLDRQYIDNILQQVDHGDLCIAQPIVKTEETESKPSLPLTFDNILLPRSKNLLLEASKAISKKYQKSRQKKKNELRFKKQISQHPRDRLAHKIKSNNDEINFIKQVLSHICNSLARKTRDIYDDMETVDCNPPEDVDLSDAEAVQYNIENAETVQAQLKGKKSSNHIVA